MTIRQVIETSSRKHPDKIFLYYGDERITYEQFNENANKAAHVFLNSGIGKGDRVCFFIPNSPEFLYGWFGLAKIGAVMVPINTAYRTEEVKYIVNHSEANTILVLSSLKEVVEQVRSEAPLLKNVMLLGGDIGNTGYIPFEEALKNASPDLDPMNIDEEDVFQIMYTSGTTGPPKGVMQTNRSVVLVGYGYKHWVDITPEDRLFTCLPLFHGNAQGYSTLGALASEAGLILVDRFSASSFWDQVRHYKATIFNYIGAMLTILSKQPESEKDRDHQVRVAYGTPALDKEFQDYMEQRFGITLISGYALTECPLGTIQPLHGLRKEKSIGLPRQVPDAGFMNEIKVVDEHGIEVPARTVGEIILKNPATMTGYFKEPELTKAAIRHGWLYTGDYGWIDEDGYFYFADRKKDVIRRRGENVSS
ncbi:MAG: AMP-binding protein, partial [Desulfobacterales bacterium]|nr:AMP-binding protein [Desulfobacterales bacterium]